MNGSERFQRHKRDIARGVLIAGVAGFLLLANRNAPHVTDVRIDLGDRAPRIRALSFTWERDGVAERSTTLRYPRRAPRIVEHTADLPPGRWVLEVIATEEDGTAGALQRSFEVPLEGALLMRFPAEN